MRTTRSILAMAAVAACAASSVFTDAHAADAVSAQRHRRVDAIFAPWNVASAPGCAVGISRNGSLDYARGYGMSNLVYQVPIAADSVFHAASISKQFTAFAIGLLAQEGVAGLGYVDRAIGCRTGRSIPSRCAIVGANSGANGTVGASADAYTGPWRHRC